MDWGIFVLQGAIAAATIVASVAALFKTMNSTYGSIVTSLQHQNTSQQVQISSLQNQVDLLRDGREQNRDQIQGLKDALVAEKADCDKRLLAVSVRVRKLENGGAAPLSTPAQSAAQEGV